MAKILVLLKLNSHSDFCVVFQTYLQKKKYDTLNLIALQLHCIICDGYTFI